MNEEQLKELRTFLLSLGFKLDEVEQRITKFDNNVQKREVTITYQFRFSYALNTKV